MRFTEKIVMLSVVFCLLFGVGFSCNLFSQENRKNLVHNPGFEEAITVPGEENLLPRDWSCYNKECSWHEKPKGKGMSQWSIDNQVAHSGKHSLKVKGDGNRGMAMQTVTHGFCQIFSVN